MTANEISIHYEIAGEGPSVVLLHDQWRNGRVAGLDAVVAAWGETAPGRATRWFRQRAGNSDQAMPVLFQGRHAGEQALGVRVLRRIE